MASILIRTSLIYALLMLVLRLMGRREIGQLDASDLVSVLLISELAAIPIDDPDIPLLNAVISILLIFSLEVILSTVKNRCGKLRRAIDGDACYIIYKGRLLQRALSENRISLSELLSSLRTQGIGNISEVDYALLEQNGTISVLQSSKTDFAHTLILDGDLCEKAIRTLSLPCDFPDAELDRRGYKKEDVFLMTLTDSGKIDIILKEQC